MLIKIQISNFLFKSLNGSVLSQHTQCIFIAQKRNEIINTKVLSLSMLCRYSGRKGDFHYWERIGKILWNMVSFFWSWKQALSPTCQSGDVNQQLSRVWEDLWSPCLWITHDKVKARYFLPMLSFLIFPAMFSLPAAFLSHYNQKPKY